MAGIDYTFAGLLASIRRRIMLPDSDDSLDDDDLLAITNEEIQTFIAPLLVKVGGEYLVASKDVDIVAGTSRYSIPERAIGNKLRDLLILDGDSYRSLNQLEPEDADQFAGTGSPEGFVIEDGTVVLFPTPDAAGTLQFKYYKRPGRLLSNVVFSGLGSPVIRAPSGGGDELPYFFVSAAETAYPNQFDDGTAYEVFLPGVPSPTKGGVLLPPAYPFAGYATTKDVVTVVSTTTIYIQVVGTTNASMEDGYFDTAPYEAFGYLAAEGTSPFLQIPGDLVPLLAQRVAAVALESIGDPRAQTAHKKAEGLKDELLPLLSPRAEGKGRVIINRNAPGFRRR